MSQDFNNKNINGKEQPIYRSNLDGRSIEHVEMDYNLSLIGKTIQGYKVMGSGLEGSLDLTNDQDKVLKLHKILAADTDLISNGGKIHEYVWVVVDSSSGGGVNSSLIPDTSEVYDLGSPTNKFRDLYLTNNTIYLGEDSISTFEGRIKVNNIPLIGESDFLAEIDERARLLGVETELRTTAVSSLNNKLTTINDENSALAQSVLDLDTSFTADLVNAIKGEQLARTEAISGINETLTSLSTGDGAIAEVITDLDTKFTTELNNAVTGEQAARTEAIAGINETLTSLSTGDSASAEARTALDTKFTTELNDAITGEQTIRTEAIANIEQKLTTLTNADEASAEAITDLSTSFSSEIEDSVSIEKSAREQAILAETNARISEIQAVSDLIPTEFNTEGLATTEDLEAEANNRVSQIVAEAAETARLLGLETTARTQSDSSIVNTLNTLNTANVATAQSVSDLNTTFTQELTDKVSGEALLRTEALVEVNESITALSDKDKALAISITNLGTKFTTDIDEAITGEADIRTSAITDVTSQILALSDADSASITRVDKLEAQYTIEDGSITGLKESSAIKSTIDSAVTTANQATVTSTTNLIAALDNKTAGVTTQQTADINELTGKVNAQYTLEVNGDGHVAGMKLGANEEGSSIAFTADSFKVSSEDVNGTLLTPFSIVNGQVAFNGAVSFSAGPAGPSGPAGDTGPRGTTGSQGSGGGAGPQGTTGSQGSGGDTGPQGSQGTKGDNGSVPNLETYLTASTYINGGSIETGILKSGHFAIEMKNAAGVSVSDIKDAAWNGYAIQDPSATTKVGMGINLDKGAINAKNFYVDPDGNAKFKGDMDIEGGVKIGGELASELFQVDEPTTDEFNQPIPRKLKFKSSVYFGATRFNDFQNDFETIADDYSQYKEDNPKTGGDGVISPSVTLSHNYIKRNDVSIESGDLVKLNENNELVKATSAQDNTIVGILWDELDFTMKEDPLDRFLINGKDMSEKPHHYRDSLGNKIPPAARDNKGIWRVASIGDSREGTLTGMKVCDQNGLILKGDLVCSSDTPGYVMKQPVEYAIVGFENELPIYEERQIINSFTVGKCMEDCAFDTEGKGTGIYGYLYCG